MSDKKIVLVGGLEGVNSKKDNTFSLRFGTQELTTQQKLSILEAQNGFGILVFKYDKETMSDEEMEEIDKSEVDLYDNTKTKSQRLRNTLYVLFQQTELKGHEKPEIVKELWKDFYSTRMELLINQIKARLEP